MADGPLQPGNYRLTVSTGMTDRFGNVMAAPYVLVFTVAPLSGYTIENRSNDTTGTATALAMIEDPAGSTLKSAGGRGNLWSCSDTDYFSFTGTAGDLLVLAVEQPYAGSGSRLSYVISEPDGSHADQTSTRTTTPARPEPPVALPATGTYTVHVAWYECYGGEYRFRLLTSTPGNVQLEGEPNDSTTNATAVTLATNNDTKFASVAGIVATSGDLDYFNLGTVNAGQTIFLTSRKPSFSPIDPVVSVYNAQNGYVVESGSGRPFDGVAQVNITQTGTYYAVMRAGNNTGGLLSQYVMDIQIVPTGSVNFPNLQVTGIALPPGTRPERRRPSRSPTRSRTSARSAPASAVGPTRPSCRPIPSTATRTTSHWASSRTRDAEPGRAVHQHPTLRLPDGIGGDYYIIVSTDSGNAVNEYLLEGDNVTPSAGTFHVDPGATTRTLKVEGLAVSGPDGSGHFAASWTTANRGSADVAGRLDGARHGAEPDHARPARDQHRPQATGLLAAGGTLGRSLDLAGLAPGHYQLTVTTDSQSQIYEFTATAMPTPSRTTPRSRSSTPPATCR